MKRSILKGTALLMVVLLAGMTVGCTNQPGASSGSTGSLFGKSTPAVGMSAVSSQNVLNLPSPGFENN